ncbi:MAG: plasmid pRiA4b ORF-3 family protein [Acidimicrobiales bacterium]
MPEPAPPPVPSVYQLRVVLRGISPLIWRRIEVGSDTTLADLHTVLQAAFSWDDYHLHRFKVQGREYEGLYEYGQVRLADLGLRVGERFVYDYDFSDDWRHDLRVEQILAVEVARTYPRCTGGRRAGPPEDSGGPREFMERIRPHQLWEIARRVAEIIEEIIENPASRDDYYEELVYLRPWLETEHFERRALNRALAGLAAPGERAA